MSHLPHLSVPDQVGVGARAPCALAAPVPPSLTSKACVLRLPLRLTCFTDAPNLPASGGVSGRTPLCAPVFHLPCLPLSVLGGVGGRAHGPRSHLPLSYSPPLPVLQSLLFLNHLVCPFLHQVGSAGGRMDHNLTCLCVLTPVDCVPQSLVSLAASALGGVSGRAHGPLQHAKRAAPRHLRPPPHRCVGRVGGVGGFYSLCFRCSPQGRRQGGRCYPPIPSLTPLPLAPPSLVLQVPPPRVQARARCARHTTAQWLARQLTAATGGWSRRATTRPSECGTSRCDPTFWNGYTGREEGGVHV